MMRWTWLALVVVAGCGWDEEKYVAEYVAAECDYAFRCYTEAQVEFYGWESQEDCVAARGSEVTGQVEGCTYDKKVAKDCVKQFEELECPAEGDDPGALLPAICATVFACDGTGGDTDAEDTDTDL